MVDIGGAEAQFEAIERGPGQTGQDIISEVIFLFGEQGRVRSRSDFDGGRLRTVKSTAAVDQRFLPSSLENTAIMRTDLKHAREALR
jgi:hypothetical protein